MGLFGVSKEEIWKQLCEEIDADIVDGGFWKGKRVEGKHNNWRIYLDIYTVSTGNTTVTYTRLRMPFVNFKKFYFKIYKSGIFSNLGKIMGMQDIEIGYEEFDDRYIIKGSNEEWVKKLFQNSRVRSLIQTQPKMSLEIKKGEGVFGPKFKEEESELYFLVPGVLKDVELLKKLFELFSEVIEELERMNITSTQSTDVNLY